MRIQIPRKRSECQPDSQFVVANQVIKAAHPAAEFLTTESTQNLDAMLLHVLAETGKVVTAPQHFNEVSVVTRESRIFVKALGAAV